MKAVIGMAPGRCIDLLQSIRLAPAICTGSVIGLCLFAPVAHAQTPAPPQAETVPTLTSLPSLPRLARGHFVAWCGNSDRIIITSSRKEWFDVYDGGRKIFEFSFSDKNLVCPDNSRSMLSRDESLRVISEWDLTAGRNVGVFGTFEDKSQRIAFSPDLKNVASNKPVKLPSQSVKPVIISAPPEATWFNLIRWRPDSLAFLAVSSGRLEQGFRIEIHDVQGNRVSSHQIGPGFIFVNAWFAGPDAIYLLVSSYKEEQRGYFAWRCPISTWKCTELSQDVVSASVGGDGMLATVKAIGEYTMTGETIIYPPKSLVEIRDRSSRVLARQTFSSPQRFNYQVEMAPTGAKLALTFETRCPKGRTEPVCYGDVTFDLTKIVK